MLKISDFAQLSRISPKTLRLYDRLGLLKPATVDRQNNYRYYSASQLPRLNRILVFKELGFSLEQIGKLLDDDLSVSEIRGMLRLKQLELEHKLAEDVARLNNVTIRLQELEQEKSMSNYEIILKPVKSQLVAGTLGVIPDFDNCTSIIEQLFDRVYGYVFSQGIKDVGSGINVYHETKLRDKHIPLETIVPISHTIPNDDSQAPSVWVYELPEVETMACVVHHGSFNSLGNAYCSLLEWVEKYGYQIAGSTREVYLHYEREGDPNQYVTEVQIPVEKVTK